MHSKSHYDRNGEKHLKLGTKYYTVKINRSLTVFQIKVFSKNNLDFGKKFKKRYKY